METNILKIITDALEQYNTEAFYKTRIFIEPKNLPSFKRVTIELYKIPKFGYAEVVVKVDSIERITNEEEKEAVLTKLATSFLHLIFKYLANETSKTRELSSNNR